MPAITAADVPNWTEVGGLIANSVLALAAIGVTIVLHVAEGRRAKLATESESRREQRAIEAEKRQRRAQFARDLIIWFERGKVHFVIGGDSLLVDESWVRMGHELEASSALVDSPGAIELMRAARTVREEMERLDPGDRISAAIFITQLLKLWAKGWVEDPEPISDYPVAEWVAFAASSERKETDVASDEGVPPRKME